MTRAFWAGLLAALLMLAGASPASAGPANSYLPNRYHCDYNGHGYHRCDGGYPNEHNPGSDNYRPPNDAPDCPRPHRHTGLPYDSGCDKDQG
jgi:hypothetical protein